MLMPGEHGERDVSWTSFRQGNMGNISCSLCRLWLQAVVAKPNKILTAPHPATDFGTTFSVSENQLVDPDGSSPR